MDNEYKEETIVIHKITESVKVSELEGREKTIYDYAYNKGHADGSEGKALLYGFAVFLVVMIIYAITALSAK
jgi:hypothetical protein